ncbi:ABC transporter permease [Enemella evansiae]|uniref:Peptide ABC transporter n=1 Tax=Enemella evansiae TaxID=2016499 RepID=A0A255GWB8_9ACTN|nr:ABC transporter permease [Enemella evansiae]PFG68928.1 peptide/nickel transport system permease protein [Propionibacteriaceae bacterium ES.041]OYN96961.1 peptide ABC transporter [Enemella evansiae]OYO00606.1 peptide ABC transporter [Enemella evansiae]OYO06197.1 peptide ABC transporter [Enemella evansiae]OYO11885.1 peptide ABC transporter [Enemella evansiae]
MTRYLLNRLGQALVTMLLVSFVVFAGIRAIPGDPALVMAGEDRSPEAIQAVRDQYGLDKPVILQYLIWISRAIRLDFGNSARTGVPVLDQIVSALPVTIELALLSMLFATVLGIATGTLAAVKRGRPAEWFANGLALLGLSVPNFWFGILLILAFAVAIPLLPASGFVPFGVSPLENLQRMILPAIVLGSGLSAVVMRQTRSGLLDSLSADYVRTARAKGLLGREVLVSHALRNSLITVVTVLGLQLGNLIAGAVVTEQVFTLPGFGKLTLDGVFQRDYPVIQAVVLLTSFAYILINLLVDLTYSVLDPRIRLAGGSR